MSVYLAATIGAAALLVGSAVMALAIVRQGARRREAEAPRAIPASPTPSAASAEERDAMLLRMSHDLRGPLGSVVTLCQLLLDGDAGPLSMKQHQYVEVIRRGGQTVLALVDDMLDLIGLESGRSDLDPDATDLSALARQVTDSTHATAREKGIPVQVSVPNRPVTGIADGRRLRHVLARMVEHVVAATDHGYVEVVVEPTAAGDAALTVRNTRDGLSETARRSLEAGLNLEAPATALPDGQPPLPLAIAARLARRLGSPIAVRTGEDEGLALTMAVPLAARDAPALAPDAGAARPGARILIIDDDDAERGQVAKRLQESGYAVSSVASGDDGLRLMRESAFDAVVLDLVMPGLSGLEVLRAARADSRLAHLPFVVLSAMYMTRTERDVLGPGVASVVRKGEVSGDELLRAVERALAHFETIPAGDRHV
ncbi:MAG TPA: hybrid sensor histidine kinase/response regulator [Polyangia bacterium]|nr:hybrid sensor histidine kinase/response regulator [Polyangia bacterium]